MVGDEKDRKDEQDIVDGEVVAEFDDHTLLNLPPIPEEEIPSSSELGAVARNHGEAPNSGRRMLFTRLAIGGVAALALGGSGALLSRRNSTTVILPNGSSIEVEEGGADITSLLERIAKLELNLASMTSERDQLLSDLNSGDSNYEKLRQDLTDAQAEIDALRDANTLWSQLDDIGLDALIRTAFVLVQNGLTVFLAVLGLLQSGVAQGQSVIAKFVALLPTPSEGISWLRGRVSRLSSDLDVLGELVEDVVESAEPLTTLVADFIIWILDRLPFGSGDRARASLDVMQTLISSLPDLVLGINTNILDPIADWFDDQGEGSFAAILLDPIDEHLVQPARNALDAFSTYESIHQENLVDPVEDALARRAALREQIEEAQRRVAGFA